MILKFILKLSWFNLLILLQVLLSYLIKSQIVTFGYMSIIEVLVIS